MSITHRNNPDFLDSIAEYHSSLGHGAFGVVIQAIDIDRTVTAIKFMHPTSTQDEEQTHRECKITIGLREHPNVIKMLNFVVKKELTPSQIQGIMQISSPMVRVLYEEKLNQLQPLEWTCIQMEICGKNLRDWLAEPDTRIDSIITQMTQVTIVLNLISGLKFLHDNQIIHRDLKPANVMFSRGAGYQLPVKIGDFGLSRKLRDDEPSSLTSNVGTRYYSAPEVRSGKYSYQADLFSLGLVIWEVVALLGPDKKCGIFDRVVYDGEEDLVKSHILLGDSVKDVIIRLTKRKPEDRLTSLKETENITTIWENITLPRQEMVAKTESDLKLCLKFATSGSTIILVEGVYVIDFHFKLNNIKVIKVKNMYICSFDCCVFNI